MKPDVVGKWKAPKCALELRADGTFRTLYDSSRPGQIEVYGGVYQVTFDNHGVVVAGSAQPDTSYGSITFAAARNGNSRFRRSSRSSRATNIA